MRAVNSLKGADKLGRQRIRLVEEPLLLVQVRQQPTGTDCSLVLRPEGNLVDCDGSIVQLFRLGVLPLQDGFESSSQVA